MGFSDFAKAINPGEEGGAATGRSIDKMTANLYNAEYRVHYREHYWHRDKLAHMPGSKGITLSQLEFLRRD